MIKELLEIGLKIDSAAKTIDAYLNGEIKADKLKVLKDGRVSDLETFGLKLATDDVRNKLGLDGDSSKILRDVLKAVSNEKKKQKEQKSQEKMLAASIMTDRNEGGTWRHSELGSNSAIQKHAYVEDQRCRLRFLR